MLARQIVFVGKTMLARQQDLGALEVLAAQGSREILAMLAATVEEVVTVWLLQPLLSLLLATRQLVLLLQVLVLVLALALWLEPQILMPLVLVQVSSVRQAP